VNNNNNFNKILELLDSLPIQEIEVSDKIRLYREIQRRFGIDSLSIQVLGGTQMIGNSIQISISDKSAIGDLVEALVHNFGKEAALEIVKKAVEKL